MANKYDYYKVIQSKYNPGDKWEDEDFYECNSQGAMTREERKNLRENLKAYRENGPGVYRVVFKKELKKVLT